MPFSVGVVFSIEVEHQSEDVGGHHPTLDHLVHARLVSVIFCFKREFLLLDNLHCLFFLIMTVTSEIKES